ncbi:hypothetical protein [Jeotgalibacillus aurantiacus]|uniref:hypothetical protein n=1 Tax=Jeotgalibacillus aurantiacus TaxID=2763266 RepID=UPI001D0B8099|nr:hypothetical protein [Jeotgalibacillus aurantiacus]
MSYLKTINHDLHGIKKLLLFNDDNNFNSVAVYSLFRDSCLMLYEIINVLKSDGILKEEIAIYKKIEPIRHKIKSSQGKSNRDIFNKILDTHFNLFGDDIDNLGFYLDRGNLVGSTLYVTYVYDETPFFNSKDTEGRIRDFSKEIGNNMAVIIDSINQPVLLPSNKTLSIQQEDYECKDVWHKRLFKEDLVTNVCLMRLLIIQNEISSCLWIKKHLNHDKKEFSLDKYLLLRLSSIRFYQTMENLIDIKDRASQQYSALTLNDLDELLLIYKKNLQKETKKLRNLLHYNNEQVNFFDYVEGKLEENNKYADNLLQVILNDFFPIIQRKISDVLNVSAIESMSDWEKIMRRIKTKIKLI